MLVVTGEAGAEIDYVRILEFRLRDKKAVALRAGGYQRRKERSENHYFTLMMPM